MRDSDSGRNGQWHPQYEQQKGEGMSRRYQYLDRQYWVDTIFSKHDMVVCGDFQWDAIMCWGFGSVSQPGVLCREIGQAHG